MNALGDSQANMKSTLIPRLARLDEQLSVALNTAKHLLELVRGSVPEVATLQEKVPPPGCILERVSVLEHLAASLNERLESIAGEL
jgi:hypothetical protein